jgi:hypothetical protein
MSWLSRRWDAVAKNTGEAVASIRGISLEGIGEKIESISDSIEGKLQSAASKIQSAVETVEQAKDTAMQVADFALQNPGVAQKAAHVVSDISLTVAKDTAQEYAVYYAANPGRMEEIKVIGGSHAVVNTVGPVVDLGGMAVNGATWLPNMYSKMYTGAVNTALSFVGLDGSNPEDGDYRIKAPQIPKIEGSFTDWALEKTDEGLGAVGINAKPQNEIEENMIAVVDGAGQTVAFGVLTVGSSGGWAAVKAGATAVRVAEVTSATSKLGILTETANALRGSGAVAEGLTAASKTLQLSVQPGALITAAVNTPMNIASAKSDMAKYNSATDETAIADAAGDQIAEQITTGNADLQARIAEYGRNTQGQEPGSDNPDAPPLRLADADTGDGADNTGGGATIRPASHTPRPKDAFNKAAEENGLAAIVITLIENIFNVKAKDEKGQDAFWAKAIKGFLGEQFKPAAEGTQLAAATNEGSGPDVLATISPAKGPAAMKPAA